MVLVIPICVLSPVFVEFKTSFVANSFIVHIRDQEPFSVFLQWIIAHILYLSLLILYF